MPLFAPDTMAPLIAVGLLGLAICLLDSFDIAMPRGDSLGVGGALVAAGLVIVEPDDLMLVALVSLLALVVAHAARHKGLLTAPLGIDFSVRVLAITITAAVLVALELSTAGLPPAVTAVIAAGTYLGVELIANQVWLSVSTRRPLTRLLRGNIRRQSPIIAAQVSVSALLVVTYGTMQAWALLPVVVMLLLVRQSYAMLLQMLETYRTTVEVLAEAAEGQDSRLHGHAERTAHIARAICGRLGLSAMQVEQASYAALLHDIHSIGEHPVGQVPVGRGRSSEILEGVEFLKEVIPVMRLCDGLGQSDTVRENDVLIAMVVALAGDIDAVRVKSVSAAHIDSALERVSLRATSVMKARVVAAALELGYQIPAVR